MPGRGAHVAFLCVCTHVAALYCGQNRLLVAGLTCVIKIWKVVSPLYFAFVFAFVVVLASTAQLARIGLRCVLASTACTNRSSLQFAFRALAHSRDLRFLSI